MLRLNQARERPLGPHLPKGQYVFADREVAYWTETEKNDPSAAPWITDSVLAIVAVKREEVVRSDHQFSDIVKLLPTPGHTIDHPRCRSADPARTP